MTEDMFETYKSFVRSRHEAWLHRQLGESPPWTTDQVIRKHKFTNVFRVLDRGTQFVVKELLYREKDIDKNDALMRCFLYRYTNRPEPWQHFHRVVGRYPLVEDLGGTLNDVWQGYKDRGYPIFGNAYKMFVGKENSGKDRLSWVLDLTEYEFGVGSALPDLFFKQVTPARRLEILKAIPRCADFMGMQVLTDIGMSRWLSADENLFVVAGPGAKVGAKLVAPDQKPLDVIQLAWRFWRESGDVVLPGLERTPSLMDVQNTFCEFGKYVRWRDSAQPRRLYTGNGKLPVPFYPPFWKYE